MTDQPMNPEFAVHKLNADGLAKAQEIAEVFNDILNKLLFLCAPGRELSLVKTKLEEACFFAKKSMAIDAKNQLIPEPIPTPGSQ